MIKKYPDRVPLNSLKIKELRIFLAFLNSLISRPASKKLYVNVFVAGQYNALLQSNSNFNLAVKKLFQGKNDLLLQNFEVVKYESL
jgi:hypothetical protein